MSSLLVVLHIRKMDRQLKMPGQDHTATQQQSQGQNSGNWTPNLTLLPAVKFPAEDVQSSLVPLLCSLCILCATAPYFSTLMSLIWMYFSLVFIFPHTYDQSQVSYMATKSKEVTNNGIFCVLYCNRTGCGSQVKPTGSYEFSPE